MRRNSPLILSPIGNCVFEANFSDVTHKQSKCDCYKVMFLSVFGHCYCLISWYSGHFLLISTVSNQFLHRFMYSTCSWTRNGKQEVRGEADEVPLKKVCFWGVTGSARGPAGDRRESVPGRHVWAGEGAGEGAASRTTTTTTVRKYTRGRTLTQNGSELSGLQNLSTSIRRDCRRAEDVAVRGVRGEPDPVLTRRFCNRTEAAGRLQPDLLLCGKFGATGDAWRHLPDSRV